MLSDNRRIQSQRLSPELARLLEDGTGIVTEASRTRCRKIAPVHFLGYFARTGGTLLRVALLEPRQMDPERFCDLLYETTLEEGRPAGMPISFRPEELE